MNWLRLLTDPDLPLRDALAIFERDYIALAVAKCDGDLRATAKLLGIGYSTMKAKAAEIRRRAA